MSTIDVTTDADSGAGSLRAALAAAQAGDVIDFTLPNGVASETIRLTSGTLAVNTGVTVDGAGRVTVDGGGNFTDFTVNNSSASAVTFNGLTVSNGYGAGATGATGAADLPTATGGDAAGGIFLQSSVGSVNLTNDSFVNDAAKGGDAGSKASGGPGFAGSGAGAVFVEPNVTVTASNLSFSGDSATGGSGIALVSTAYPDSNSTVVTAAGGGTGAAAAVCFVQGTRIRTLRGDVAVEDLRVGDLALNDAGAFRPIRWLGRRTVDLRRVPDREAAMPVRLRAGSLGGGLPLRDLRVSPGHSMLVEGGFVHARALVNGRTVTRDLVDRVTYWHVELDTHDVVIAEGAPSESYLDMGNREFFQGEAWTTLHGMPDADPKGVDGFCRPLHLSGPVVEAARATVAAAALEASMTGFAKAA